jgi:hypothetical protein
MAASEFEQGLHFNLELAEYLEFFVALALDVWVVLVSYRLENNQATLETLRQ